MIRKVFCIVSLILLTFLVACGGKEDSSSATPTGAVEFSAPTGWVKEQPTSSMRQGQYRLPRAEGDEEDAEMAIFHFPGQGGSVQANVDRWIGQFVQPDGSPASEVAKVGNIEVEGNSVTIVDVSGTYNASMGGPMMSASVPKQNYRMLAAIINTPAGPWFFKLTGPANTISKWEQSFDEFSRSLRVR